MCVTMGCLPLNTFYFTESTSFTIGLVDLREGYLTQNVRDESSWNISSYLQHHGYRKWDQGPWSPPGAFLLPGTACGGDTWRDSKQLLERVHVDEASPSRRKSIQVWPASPFLSFHVWPVCATLHFITCLILHSQMKIWLYTVYKLFHVKEKHMTWIIELVKITNSWWIFKSVLLTKPVRYD